MKDISDRTLVRLTVVAAVLSMFVAVLCVLADDLLGLVLYTVASIIIICSLAVPW